MTRMHEAYEEILEDPVVEVKEARQEVQAQPVQQ